MIESIPCTHSFFPFSFCCYIVLYLYHLSLQSYFFLPIYIYIYIYIYIQVLCVVDSIDCVDLLQEQLHKASLHARVLIDIDGVCETVGYHPPIHSFILLMIYFLPSVEIYLYLCQGQHRTGVPSVESGLRLAQYIEQNAPNISLRGVQVKEN